MKKYFIGFIASLSVFGLLQIAGPSASAQFDAAKDQACQGVGVVEAGNDCDSDTGGSGIDNVIQASLNILSLVAGVIAVIMIIIGGIKFLTSQGDPGATAGARNTIIYAAVGIVIVVLAQIIVQFVLNRADPNPPTTIDVNIPCEGDTCLPL